ncbi:MAG: RNA polymerase sigma factor [Bacteroidales bacterium]|nr:RNA polymerase sigma factor [Bacteroidales bacterium]
MGLPQDYLTDAFVRLRQKLKAASGRILPDVDGAEDVLQDSFVRLWRRQYPIGSAKEAEALLSRTVRNASLNERRRARTVPLDLEVADDSPDNESKERAYAEMYRKMEQELTKLQKYIIEEKEFGGRTLDSIAKELKMEPTAVRMQLSRARMKLRESLKKSLKDDR